MRSYDIKQVRVVHKETAEAFESALNAVLEEITDPKAEIEYNHAKGFCAYVTYSETRKKVEGAKDLFNMEGVRYLCAECPYFEKEYDGRVKWGYCDMSVSGRTRKDSECCELFYRLLASGEIKPNRIKEV